jgi:hypothetical protein
MTMKSSPTVLLTWSVLIASCLILTHPKDSLSGLDPGCHQTLWTANLNSMTPQFRTFGHPGYKVERTTAPQYVFSGDAGLRLITPAGIKYKRAAINKWLPFITSKPVVVDVWFQLPTVNTDVAFEVAVEGFDGTNGHMASVRWVDDNAFSLLGWDYWGAAGSWANVPGGRITLTRGWHIWHKLRIILDYKDETYVKLEIDDATFDMPQSRYQKTIDAQGPYMSLSVLVWNQSTTQVDAVVGAARISILDCPTGR